MASSSVERFSDKEEVDGSTPSSPTYIMEQGESFNIPQLDDETKKEVYEDLRQKIIKSFEKYSFAQELFSVNGSTRLVSTSRVVQAPLTDYTITRNVQADNMEISIDRTKRLDNPNIAMESVRFRVPRVGISDFPPLIEYHRTLKKGGSRTLQNNLLALRKVEKFVGEIEKSLKPPR